MVGARTRAGEPIRSGNPKCVATHGIPLPRSDGWRPPRGPRRLPAARARHVQSRTTIKTTNGVCCLAARPAHTPPHPVPTAASPLSGSRFRPPLFSLLPLLHPPLSPPPPAATLTVQPTKSARPSINAISQGEDLVPKKCQMAAKFSSRDSAPHPSVALCAPPRSGALHSARAPQTAQHVLIISRWACMLDRARPPKRSPKVAFCIK